MKRIAKLFLIGAVATTQSFSYCFPDGSCEKAISDMSSNIEKVINNNFNKLDSKIDKAIEAYKKINKELDKEIYVLTVALKGETLLYKKLSEFELYSAQSKQINDIEISQMINIKNILEKKQNKGKKEWNRKKIIYYC